MSYFIFRNEQQYGPYTLHDIQSQIAAGTMVPADQAQRAQGGPRTTVGEILAQAAQGFIPPDAPIVPLPPDLHWALLLLIGIFFSPFTIGWQIYQMVWIRNIDRQSKALLYFGLAVGGFIFFFGLGMVILLHDTNNPNPWGALPIVIGALCMLVFTILNIFDIRRSMLDYYNTVEPIGLRLSGVMTFFFNVYYFQHHMSRIAAWKRTGYLAPQG